MAPLHHYFGNIYGNIYGNPATYLFTTSNLRVKKKQKQKQKTKTKTKKNKKKRFDRWKIILRNKKYKKQNQNIKKNHEFLVA